MCFIDYDIFSINRTKKSMLSRLHLYHDVYLHKFQTIVSLLKYQLLPLGLAMNKQNFILCKYVMLYRYKIAKRQKKKKKDLIRYDHLVFFFVEFSSRGMGWDNVMGSKVRICYMICIWVRHSNFITVLPKDLWLIDSSPMLHSVTEILVTNISISLKIIPNKYCWFAFGSTINTTPVPLWPSFL